MADRSPSEGQPDLDLLEYVVVSAADVAGLAAVASAVVEVVEAGDIRVVDAVVLARRDRGAKVSVAEPTDHEELTPLAAVVDGSPDGVLLSLHDIELAAVTLAPYVAALLLLVEDRWAGRVSRAARSAGGRLSGGERIGRSRVLAALDEARPGGSAPTMRPVRSNLLSRSPIAAATSGSAPVVDSAAQVRHLAGLVDRGLLSLEQYEVQRRRVLGG